MKEAAYAEILRMIKEEEPPRPSTRLSDSGEALASISAQRHTEPAKLTKLVRGELDWIVMKCLEKDRNRRYETANGFAADVQRYLNDEPVQACPPSDEAEQHALADARRIDADQQRAEAEKQSRIAKEQRDHAQESELLARRRLYAAHINLAHEAREAGNSARALELLEGQRPKFDQEDLRTFEWYYLWRLCHASHRLTLAGHTGGVTSVAYSPDGKMLASASIDTTVKVWDTATGQPLATLQGQPATVFCVAFSPDGKTLASAGGKSSPAPADGSGDQSVRLWDVDTWKEKAVFTGDWGAIRSLEFSPDGKTLAAGTYLREADKVDGLVKLWDLATGDVRATLRGHEEVVMSVAFSPDSQKLASSSAWTNPRVKLWDLTAEPPRVLYEWEGAWSVAFSPDGQTLAATMPAGADGKVKLRDVATGSETAVYQPRAADISSVVFAPDGKTLAMCCADRTVRLWEPGAGRHWTLSHLQSVTDVVFSPDGRTVASASQDRTIKIWSVDQDQDEPTLHGYRGWRSSIAYSPDGNAFAYSATGDVIRLCDPATGQERSQLSGQGPHLIGMTFSRDGKRIVAGGGIAPIKIWDIATTRELANFDSPPRGFHSLALSPDGKTLACAGEDSEVQLFDLDTYRLRTSFKPAPGWAVGAVTYSPDGKWLVTADIRGWVDFWNAATMLRGIRIRVTEAGFTWALVFSPDGKSFVTAGDGGIMKCWDAATGRLLATFRGHTARIMAIALFPDGKTLASGSDDGTVKLWDVPTGQERLTLLGHSDHVVSVAVAPDGKTLATSSRDGTVKLWRASADRDAEAIDRELDADDPASPVAQIHLANALLRIRRPGEAEEAFRLAISRLEALQAAIRPAPQEYSQLHAETQHQLARLLIAGKRVEEAEPILLEAIGGYERIVASSPEYHVALNNLGLCYVRLAQLLAGRDRPQEAATAYRKALAFTPDNATAINDLAWMLAASPDPKLRDPGKAVELAERAVALAPKQASSWNTLGVARYRAGEWQTSIDALKKAEELLAEKSFSFNAFFVAMAEWQLDRKEEAHKWFDQAVAWMAKNQPQNEELLRFHAEAAALLDVKEDK
jgi:eukaryotic-like serine/threonine-protein kinase